MQWVGKIYLLFTWFTCSAEGDYIANRVIEFIVLCYLDYLKLQILCFVGWLTFGFYFAGDYARKSWMVTFIQPVVKAWEDNKEIFKRANLFYEIFQARSQNIGMKNIHCIKVILLYSSQRINFFPKELYFFFQKVSWITHDNFLFMKKYYYTRNPLVHEN